jgi:hypothetical protein
MVDATPSGLEQLAAMSVSLYCQIVGPLLVALTISGLAVLAATGRARRVWIVLSIPVGYWLTFVGVVGYVYDRYLIAMVVTLAVLAGAGWAWIVERMPQGRTFLVVRAALLVAVLAPTVVLNTKLADDSRRHAERWMRETLTGDPVVLGTGSPMYLPNLYPFLHQTEPRSSAENLLSWNADVIVVYEEWFDRRFQPPLERVQQALRAAGYRERFANGRETPRPWAAFLWSGLNIESGLSNLSKIDPPLEIWVRDRPAAGSGDN